MSQPNQDLKSEIEYIKKLAENGDRNSLQIGKILLISSFIILAYYSIEQIIYQTQISLTLNNNNLKTIKIIKNIFYHFAPYTFTGAFIMFLISYRKQLFTKSPTPSSARAAKSVWFALILVCLFEYLANYFLLNNLKNFEIMAQISNTILEINGSQKLYIRELIETSQMWYLKFHLLISVGAVWWVCADMSKHHWLRYFSLIALFAAPIWANFNYLNLVYPSIDIIIIILIFITLPALLILNHEKN